jgi:DNA-directed RNA polymerase subunit RPC12/RpoP
MASAKTQTKVKVEYTCPRCKQDLERVSRTAFDKMIGVIVPIKRYKCMGCFWEGIRIAR